MNGDSVTDEHGSIKIPGSAEYHVSAENNGSGYGSTEGLSSAGHGSTRDRSLGQRSIKDLHYSATGRGSSEHHDFMDQDSQVEGRGRSFTTTACLEGLVRTDGHGRQLVLLDGNTVYWRGHQSTPSGSGRVKVMAGHRGGHYPAFARYVGAGMLDAAVAGPDHGRHPTAAQVLTAIRELDDRCGVLVLVASETAAILNYGIAAQKARTRGIIVKVNRWKTIPQICAMILIATDIIICIHDSTNSICIRFRIILNATLPFRKKKFIIYNITKYKV